MLGRGSFNANFSVRQYHYHFLNDPSGSASYAAAVREARGRLHAATISHLNDADVRMMEREAEEPLKEATVFLDHANNTRLHNE